MKYIYNIYIILYIYNIYKCKILYIYYYIYIYVTGRRKNYSTIEDIARLVIWRKWRSKKRSISNKLRK